MEEIAITRIKALRAERDGDRWDQAMHRFTEVAEAMATMDYSDIDGSLMEAAIDAAQADATTGEMMGVLKNALGWRAPHEY
ncbi:MAG: hypothetical protein DRJ28_08045 [Actinobacteria bacterium]|nr:MAG: hypothetical protein DRJ28_08045 [Actinomycetota bacterium]